MFKGTLRVRLHPKNGIQLVASQAGKKTAKDAEEVLVSALEAAKSHKVGLHRWSFYCYEKKHLWDGHDREIAQIPTEWIAQAKDEGYIPTIGYQPGCPQPQVKMVKKREARIKPDSGIIDIL